MLITCVGSIGNTWIVDERQFYFKDGNIASISPRKDLDVNYLRHFFRSSLFWNVLSANSNGSAYNALTIQKLKKLKIPLPPLPQQKKIAAILDAADAYRQQTRALIGKYEELSQSLFLEMFGDPVRNEKGWEKVELKEVATISSGITKGRKNRKDKSIGEMPYVRVANVQDGYLDLSEIKTIPAFENDLKRFLLEKGDVLMTEGGDPDKLGRGAVWRGEVEQCLHQNHIFKVRVERNILKPIYFNKLAGSIYGKRYFLKKAKQTTGIATINKTQLSRFPVLLAPLSLQNQFAERIQAIEAQKAQAEASLAQAEDLFQALLQKAFKGELV